MQVADLETRLSHAPARSEAARWMLRHRRWLVALAVLGVALLGFAALHALLAEVRLKEVRAALHAIPDGRIVLALGLTIGSYLCLTLYDVLALRAIGRPLPWRTAALASFTSYTVSHNLGLSLLTGGSARYRVYASAGLELGDVARVTLLASATFWGGVAVVGAAALLLAGAPVDLGVVTIVPLAGHVAGAALLLGDRSAVRRARLGPGADRPGRFHAAGAAARDHGGADRRRGDRPDARRDDALYPDPRFFRAAARPVPRSLMRSGWSRCW